MACTSLSSRIAGNCQREPWLAASTGFYMQANRMCVESCEANSKNTAAAGLCMRSVCWTCGNDSRPEPLDPRGHLTLYKMGNNTLILFPSRSSTSPLDCTGVLCAVLGVLDAGLVASLLGVAELVEAGEGALEKKLNRVPFPFPLLFGSPFPPFIVRACCP